MGKVKQINRKLKGIRIESISGNIGRDDPQLEGTILIQMGWRDGMLFSASFRKQYILNIILISIHPETINLIVFITQDLQT